jgi:DNA-binding transcriptional LysR family regulator
MQFESLKVFCDLAETESFTRTARINNVTQSAVSQTISALERQFKALLIERSKKNFRLTNEGTLLYDYSRRILQTYGVIQSRMQEMKGVISGEIRVATIYSIGLHRIPPYIKQFLKNYPAVNVRLEYRRPDKVYEDVLSNTVDLGLVDYPASSAQLEVIPLQEEPLVVVCAPEHPLAKLKSIKLKMLNGKRLVSFSPDIPTRKAFDKMLKEQGVSVEHVMQFDNIETLKRAVEIESGLAILPEETVRQEVANRTLVALKLEGNYKRKWGIIHRKGKVISPALKRFIELLKETL